MIKNTLSLTIVGFIAAAVTPVQSAEFEVKKVEFQLEDATYESAVVYPADGKNLPGIFMVPNWMGVTDSAIKKAQLVAEMGYVVYVADVYTKGVRPAGPAEAGAAATALREDRPEMRKRATAALEHFRSIAGDLPLKADSIGAIGFCFGGGTILELARTGADLKGFVSFHGDLVSPTLAEDSDKIQGSVLVLHGAADPYVPAEDVNAFQDAMTDAGKDWQFVSFSGAVHSFTDPTANNPGQSQYDETTATRAFTYMHSFFQEQL